jgi:hypothetical protein
MSADQAARLVGSPAPELTCARPKGSAVEDRGRRLGLPGRACNGLEQNRGAESHRRKVRAGPSQQAYTTLYHLQAPVRRSLRTHPYAPAPLTHGFRLAPVPFPLSSLARLERPAESIGLRRGLTPTRPNKTIGSATREVEMPAYAAIRPAARCPLRGESLTCYDHHAPFPRIRGSPNSAAMLLALSGRRARGPPSSTQVDPLSHGTAARRFQQ